MFERGGIILRTSLLYHTYPMLFMHTYGKALCLIFTAFYPPRAADKVLRGDVGAAILIIYIAALQDIPALDN